MAVAADAAVEVPPQLLFPLSLLSTSSAGGASSAAVALVASELVRSVISGDVEVEEEE